MFKRLVATLAMSATVGTLTIAGFAAAPAAMATGNCDPGEYYQVAKHFAEFIQVDSSQYDNRGATTVTGHFSVSSAHTSTWTKSASISASVEAGFWVFAKASASTTASVSLAKSMTMTTSYGVDVPVPAHKVYEVDFGFRRYHQYIEKYHLVQSHGSCQQQVDVGGWVVAPYTKAFVVKPVH